MGNEQIGYFGRSKGYGMEATFGVTGLMESRLNRSQFMYPCFGSFYFQLGCFMEVKGKCVSSGNVL